MEDIWKLLELEWFQKLFGGYHVELWEKLEKNGFHEASGTDQLKLRAAFVGVQAMIEQSLYNGLLNSCKTDICAAAIHTPKPTTAFCFEENEEAEVVSEDVMAFEPALQTVSVRRVTLGHVAKAVRDSHFSFLNIVYTKEGVKQRDEKAWAVFHRRHLEYSFVNNAVDEIPPEMVGATYLWQTKEGQKFGFCLRAHQAVDKTYEGLLWRAAMGQLGKNPQLDGMVEEFKKFVRQNELTMPIILIR